MPSVSVIIPAYNCAAYIGDTLGSIFAQTFPDYEVIVVNDGSPDVDELERVLHPYLDRIVYIRQENRGPAAARNVGIRAARSPLVAFLDSDDTWEPEYLTLHVELLQRAPTIDLVYPNALFVGDRLLAGRRFMDVCPSEGEVTFARLVLRHCTVMVSATARREAIIRAGMFDESLRTSEDFDLWLRLAKQGGRIAYHRRVLVRYRRRPGSLSSDPMRICQGHLRVLEKAEQTLALTSAEARAVKRAHASCTAHLRLIEGKRALLAGDARGAIVALSEANRLLKQRKIALALLLLRVAPRAFMHANQIREQSLIHSPRWT